MEKKIIFFDIDGTLVYEQNGLELVREKTKEAITCTRALGNKVFLCTGRSKAEIYDFIWDLGIDGFIGAGGGYVEIDSEVLYHYRFSNQQVHDVIDFFDTHHYDFYLESNGGLFASKNLIPRLEFILYGDYINDAQAKQRKEARGSHFINALQTGQDMYRDDITKMCFLENKDIPFMTMKEKFCNDFTVHHCTVPAFGDDSGELSLPNIHKANAIEAVLDHLNIAKKNTIAFGDGLNDIEMLEYCHIGIAMGNAKDGLKAVADEICSSAHEDGIYEMMVKYKLI